MFTKKLPARIPLKVLLIGKTGHGKSATGNSILGRKEFQTSARSKSKTKEVRDAWTENKRFDVKVVDGPGLEDTDLSHAEDKMKACGNMAKALLMCNGGVHAFVFVNRFGTRFTPEEKKVLVDLKNILGPNFLRDHGIVAVTHGDQFEHAVKEEGKADINFNEWCNEDDGELKQLIEECNNRVVLFNNITASEEEQEKQRNTLLQYAEKLCEEKGLYTSEHFEKYAEIRTEMIRQMNQPLFKENIQREINILAAALLQLSKTPELNVVESLHSRIDNLHREIINNERNDRTMQMLVELKKIRKTTEELKTAILENNTANINLHIAELKKRGKLLEEDRQTLWRDCIFLFGLGIVIVVVAKYVVWYGTPRVVAAFSNLLTDFAPDNTTPVATTTTVTATAQVVIASTMTAPAIAFAASTVEKVANATSVAASSVVEISKAIPAIAGTVPAVGSLAQILSPHRAEVDTIAIQAAGSSLTMLAGCVIAAATRLTN